MSDKHHSVIGIDLGTTYSAVAVYNKFDEQTEIIVNPESNTETTPSVVSLDPRTKKAVVGWNAKRSADPVNTVMEIKREMGETFRPETLEKYRAQGVFRARESGYEGDPVKVQFAGEWRLPQEISAFTLMKMKDVAEAHLGETICDAVITVPAYFTEKQKKATEEAAFLAGLYPRQLIPEPTAAAICYGVDRMESERKTYLVYDLGGGTFDVSIISVEESQINVLATSGDPRLGGGDFDDRIVAWAVNELQSQFQIDISGDWDKLTRLKAHAEQAKKDLSNFNEAVLNLQDVWPQQPPQLTLTREKFEELVDDLLNKSLTFVDIALKAAEEKKGLRRDDLDAILMVGGSSKIPKIKTMLLDYFQQDESFVSAGLNPDEVVARGAATVALKFVPTEGEFNIEQLPDNTLVNPDMDDDLRIDLITEHSLGIGVQNNLVSTIIDQGANIPTSRKQGGFTNAGPTDYIDVPVYQGEGEHAYENTLIGTLKIGPMEKKPEGSHQFEVTFSLDENGLLSMTIHHINEGKTYQAQFEQKTGVGGTDALMARRSKLLKFYSGLEAPSAVGPAAMAAPVQPPTSPVPPPATAPAAGSPGGAASEPQPAEAPQPGPPTAAAPVPEPAGPATAAANPESAPAPPAEPASGAGETGLIEPAVEVPGEFKSIVRRAHKLLLNGAAPQLLEAYNRFTSLLNAGVTGDELADAGDELADVYHDCR